MNSRCSSSYDYSVKKSHWGTFINKRPSGIVINDILSCCNIPRLSNGKLLYWFDDDYLFLGFEDTKDPNELRILNIESGMQHQAIHLACTIQGVGTCINNQGVNGTRYGTNIATGKHAILEILDPYESGKFTTKPPGPEKQFIPGKNLTIPLRDGPIECFPQLKRLTTYNNSGFNATKKEISQLLWAAKGRTPHCIRSHVWKNLWGLTIPSWGGGQNYTGLYLINDHKLFQYENWTKSFSSINRVLLKYGKWAIGNPTHDLHYIQKVAFHCSSDDFDNAIILCRNEYTSRSLWEIGYMIENLLLQTKSLGISYKLKILAKDDVNEFERLKLPEAVAVLLL